MDHAAECLVVVLVIIIFNTQPTFVFMDIQYMDVLKQERNTHMPWYLQMDPHLIQTLFSSFRKIKNYKRLLLEKNGRIQKYVKESDSQKSPKVCMIFSMITTVSPFENSSIEKIANLSDHVCFIF